MIPLTKVNKKSSSQIYSTCHHSFFQPKFSVNPLTGIYEQEADSVAEKVMKIQGGNKQQTFFSPELIQKKCSHCNEEDTTQLKEDGNNTNTVPSQTENYISNLSEGTSLGAKERSFFEPRMGYDFSNVKIHTNASANQSAKDINALAYTQGDNIVFNTGKFNPETDDGKHLLAHELTHVIQQQSTGLNKIQKVDIDHRSLTWSDFKAAAPAKNIYDAETSSNIKYPDLTTIKPVIKEKPLTDVCDTKDSPSQKATKVEAEVGMDSSGIKVTSFMSQEKSWVKPLFSSEAEMKKYCKADPATVALIKGCTDYFSTGTTNATTACQPLLDDCKKNVTNGYTWEGITANDAAGCNTIFEECKKKQTGALKYTTGKNKNITQSSDCSSTLLTECLEDRKVAAADLLSHEQGHFDLTDVLAKKLETDIKALIDSYAKKTVTGCGSAEVHKLSTEVADKEVKPKIADKIKEAQQKVNEVKGYTADDKTEVAGTLRDKQDSYDSETTHGSITDKQKEWKNNIAKGTP